MANHVILVFFASVVVLLTFFGCRRHHVLPNVLVQIEGGHTMRRLLPIITVLVWRHRFPHRMWWVELCQYIHHDVVEGDVWHTSPQMLDMRYWQTYHMDFLAFEALQLLL